MLISISSPTQLLGKDGKELSTPLALKDRNIARHTFHPTPMKLTF